MKKFYTLALAVLALALFTTTNAGYTAKSVTIPEWSKAVKICSTFKNEPVKNYWIVYVKMWNVAWWYNTIIKPTWAKVNLLSKGIDWVKTSDQLVETPCYTIPLGTPVVFAADKFATWKQYVMKTLPTSGKLTYYMSRPSNLLNTTVYYVK